uniref:metal ABC transporter substrate-binding protein n=1 Tax=Halobacterium sp. (strain GN101) TaxID=88773 RepID=UPI00159EC464|nr:metal ABC transporter substrate-binding protein [Halobacterium sp. GN101]
MDEQTHTHLSRRRTLTVGAGVLSAGLAGCITSGDTDGDPESGPTVAVASFFSFYDFARKIVADTPITVRNLIPTGLHGHGWEPNASITKEILDADALIHVGPDFQPWVDRAIESLDDDDADTQRINVRDGVELVDLAASLDRDEEGIGQNRGKDPHFWLDPNRAKQSIDNLTEGFVQLAPSHENTLRTNAAAYKSGVLDELDDAYAAIFDRADRDVVQLAAHNAFQYLGTAYDIEMRPLVVNLAASGTVKASDIMDAKQTIDDNDITYIGAAVFETRRPAEQLLSETDVEAYYPVTPYAGVREDWVKQGWGYEEIARNINMPTFKLLLGNAAPDDVGGAEWNATWRNFE